MQPAPFLLKVKAAAKRGSEGPQGMVVKNPLKGIGIPTDSS